MRQVLDLSTRITGGQYDGQTLSEVLGKDVEFVKLQVRLGNYVLRESASRVLEGFRRAGLKQQKVELGSVDNGESKPSLEELMVEKAVNDYIAGVPSEDVVTALMSLPEEKRVPFELRIKEHDEKQRLLRLKELAKCAVDAYIAGEEGATEEKTLDVIGNLPESERGAYIQSVDEHKKGLTSLPEVPVTEVPVTGSQDGTGDAVVEEKPQKKGRKE